MNKRKDIVPNKLKEYRLKQHLKQKDVSQLLGFSSVERISLWEQGKNIPGLLNLLKLSSLYRATPMQLYTDIMDQAEEELADRRINKKP